MLKSKLNSLKETVLCNKFIVGASSAIVVLGTAMTCHAADGTTGTDISSSMSTAMGGVKTDTLSAIATVAPIAIGIMGVFLVWKYGIRFFKSISK